MTFVGKVLIVTNVVMAICLMIFAGAVSTVQTNWMVKANEVESRLKKEIEGYQQQVGDKEKAVKDLEIVVNQEKQRAAAAEGRAGRLEQDLKLARRDKDTAERQRNEYQTAQILADTESVNLRNETVTLRSINKKLHDKLDQYASEKSNLENETYKMQRTVAAMSDKYRRVLADREDFKSLLQKLGIDPNQKTIDTDPIPYQDVDGRIASISQQEGTGLTYVELNIGSDDTLQVGYNLYVVRNDGRGTYLGKIKITDLWPDRAVGVVIDQAKNVKIEEGDDVTTKI